jgi:hypothetical protein
VELDDNSNADNRRVFLLPQGSSEVSCPAGVYTARTYVYFQEVAVLVDIQEVKVQAGGMALLPLNIVEASAGTLLRFDADGDLVLDRVEEQVGTNRNDPGEYPGAQQVKHDQRVLSKEAGWYRGDLHVRSKNGGGTESVAELVTRAEKSGLDFIAVADRNSMASAQDPAFESDKLVLIPAMEWGGEERGVALVYGPKTVPPLPGSLVGGSGKGADSEFVQSARFAEAQSIVYRVQAQDGTFAIAHPCFPTAPWQWGLRYVNSVQVWCRSWNDVPPLSLEHLESEYRRRNEEGKLVHSLALAANTPNLYTIYSANSQAESFWDHELAKGLRASPIGGSLSSSPKVDMGEPVTYVYAEEKSVEGILDGIRRGRTYVSRGMNGPRVVFGADILRDMSREKEVGAWEGFELSAVSKERVDNQFDASIGGIIPIGRLAEFYVNVLDAKGKKVQVLRDGRPIINKLADSDKFLMRFKQAPTGRSVYRVRVVEAVEDYAEVDQKAFGGVEVLALTGPIYAEPTVITDPKFDPMDYWMELRQEGRSADLARTVNTPEGKTLVLSNDAQRMPAQFQEPAGAQFQSPPAQAPADNAPLPPVQSPLR